MASTDIYAPLVQDAQPLNEVKFSARDYPTILDSLLRRAKLLYMDVYNDFATTQQGVMFMELMAYSIAGLQWFLDRTASDVYLKTSRTASATENIVQQIGYKMGPASASGTTLTLTFPDGSPGPFTMPARWRFQGPNSLQFESYADVNVPVALAPGDTLDVDVRQGESRLLTYTSDGTRNQTFRLTNVVIPKYLAKYSVQVWVDGLEWEEKDFLEYEKTNHFEVSYLSDPPIVRFGDGSAGNVPLAGAEIKIRFLIIAGKDGNVNRSTIQSSIDKLFVLGQEVTFTVDNPEESSGGTFPQEIESAKRIAPYSFAARSAAITRPDYEALSLSFVSPSYGSPALSYAFNPRSRLDDIVFNGYVATISGLLAANTVDVSALEAAIASGALSVSDNLDLMGTYLSDLETLRTTRLLSDVSGAKSSVDSAKSAANTANGNATATYNTLVALDAYVVANVGVIPAPQYTAIRTQIATATSSASAAASAASSASSLIDGAISLLDSAIADLSDVPVPTYPTYTMYSLIQLLTTQVALVRDAFENPVTGLQTLADDNQGRAAALQAAITPELDSMQTRIGDLFNADCLSNYVQVPILALDVNGNYVAPSVGLRVELQTYLNGIAEVTQQVEVIDGSGILVPAVITIYLRISDAYVSAEVKSKVEATVIGLLKHRSFNQPLYLSDLYENVTASSKGIVYANITINGPAAYLDSKGNLVPPENMVIVLGSLAVNILGA